MGRKAELAYFFGQISCLFYQNSANSPETGISHEYTSEEFLYKTGMSTENTPFKAGHFVQDLLLSGVASANTHSSRSSSSTSTSSLSIRSFHTSEIMQSKALMNPKFESWWLTCIFQPVKFECLRCKGDRYRSDSKKACGWYSGKSKKMAIWCQT